MADEVWSVLPGSSRLGELFELMAENGHRIVFSDCGPAPAVVESPEGRADPRPSGRDRKDADR